MIERLRRRLELRRSSAAQPHRNRYRDAKKDPPWLFPEDFNDIFYDEDED